MANEQQTATVELEKFGYKQELKRTMNVWELSAFGINYMIPIAPAIIFGFILQTSGGSVALPYILAGVGMLFTAFAYMVMVRNFPLAGSVYSYVARSINPHIGFLSGWILCLDYILIPTVTAASAAVYIRQFYPQIPYAVWLLLFAVTMGLLNLLGVELLAKLGLWMVVIGEVVVFAAFFVWAYYVAVKHGGVGTLWSTMPFKFGNMSGLMTAASIAVLSYTGFDAITTLSEEAIAPKRDIPRAIFIAIGACALTMVLTGYLGMLVIPNWQTLITQPGWADTALYQVSLIAGGKGFAAFYLAGYVLAMCVFNLVATAAGARLLYGMGRDNMLPKKIFAAINKKYQTPHWNIILIVASEYILGMVMNVAQISTLINYGALGGFIMLNLGVIWLYYIKKRGIDPDDPEEKRGWLPTGSNIFVYAIFPVLGIAVLFWVFLSLDKLALTVGTSWLVIGIIYEAIKTKGYKELPPQLEL